MNIQFKHYTIRYGDEVPKGRVWLDFLESRDGLLRTRVDMELLDFLQFRLDVNKTEEAIRPDLVAALEGYRDSLLNNDKINKSVVE